MRKRFIFIIALLLLAVSLASIFYFIFGTCCDGSVITTVQAASMCNSELQITCTTGNKIPQNWGVATKAILEGNAVLSCFELLNCSTCEECGVGN